MKSGRPWLPMHGTLEEENLKIMSFSKLKKIKLSKVRSGRDFQEWWTQRYGMTDKQNYFRFIISYWPICFILLHPNSYWYMQYRLAAGKYHIIYLLLLWCNTCNTIQKSHYTSGIKSAHLVLTETLPTLPHSCITA